MKKGKNYKGEFFLPASPTNKVPGILRLDKNGEVRLELFNHFDVRDDSEKIILGDLSEFGKVTLLGCILTYSLYTPDGRSILKFTINFTFAGSHFSFEKDINFNLFSVRFNYLEEWVANSSGFELVEESEKMRQSISYTLPRPERYNIYRGFSVTLNYSSPGLKNSLIKKKVAISQKIEFRFNSSKVKLFQNVLDAVFAMQNLMTLLTQQNIWIKELLVYRKEIDEDRKTIYIPIQVFFGRVMSKKDKNISPYDMLIPYQIVKDDFKRILKVWYSKYKKLYLCLYPYFSFFNQKNLPIPESFLNMDKSLEAFHRDTVRKVNPATGKDVYHIVRLKEIFDSGKEVFNPLLRLQKIRFTKKVHKLRNDYTHSNPKAFSSPEIIYGSYQLRNKLQIIVTGALLDYLGIKKQLVKNRLTHVSIYSHYKRIPKSSARI